MKKDIKIFAVLVLFTAIVYLGVEPFAHSQMHTKLTPVDFTFEDLDANQLAGNPQKGAETIAQAGCTGCHGITAAKIPAPMDVATASASFGVVPPDLSTAGAIYDEKFLANVIKNPVKALDLEHKFNDENPYPMPAFYGLGGDIDQEIADIVAYLKSIAPEKLSSKQVYENACQRCHSIKYDNLTRITEDNALTGYMGILPPDLSMMIRSKGKPYLESFINNPQGVLHGTSMPRVGLTQVSQEHVVDYLEKVGDSKKDERTTLGIWLIGFFIIFSILAYLWKRAMWKKIK